MYWDGDLVGCAIVVVEITGILNNRAGMIREVVDDFECKMRRCAGVLVRGMMIMMIYDVLL